jgi:hypothetical protein
MSLPEEIQFQTVLDALVDTEQPFAPRFLYRFSDLTPPEIGELSTIWSGLPLWRRKALMEDLEQLGEDDTLMSFEEIGRFGLTDSNPEVRLPALRILWEYEDPGLAKIYLKLLETDPDPGVRGAAAHGLGRYVYLGELEELPQAALQEIEDRLLKVVDGKDMVAVRRYALEALGYSSRNEVAERIETAFHSKDKSWVASALFAMGRSVNEKWHPEVSSMLDNPHPQIRAEAARAAGELEILSVVDRLLELLDDSDDQVRMASIWSLSQLGGEGVHDALEELLEETEDNDEREYIEEALDNLHFNEELNLLPLLDFSDSGSDEYDEDMEDLFDGMDLFEDEGDDED